MHSYLSDPACQKILSAKAIDPQSIEEFSIIKDILVCKLRIYVGSNSELRTQYMIFFYYKYIVYKLITNLLLYLFIYLFTALIWFAMDFFIKKKVIIC